MVFERKKYFHILFLSIMIFALMFGFAGHTAKVFHIKWSPLKEGMLASGSDDWLSIYFDCGYLKCLFYKCFKLPKSYFPLID